MATGAEALKEDEAAELVQRILNSRTFSTAPKLREFLQFVCNCSLRHGAIEEVKEQQIGVHVFHRRHDYDTSNDSIVRVHARELRKRLEAYFETEGKNESIVLTIPKGRYMPLFDRTAAIPETKSDPEAQEIAEAGARQVGIPSVIVPAMPGRNVPRWGLMALGAALLLATGWLIGSRVRSPDRLQVAAPVDLQSYSFYKQLLGPIGADGNDVLLLLSNPKVLLYSAHREIPKQSPDTQDDKLLIPVPPKLQEQLEFARNLGEDPKDQRFLSVESTGYTGMGEAACAYDVGRLMLLLGRPIRLTQGRFLNWDAAKREHLIILGNPDINLWSHNSIPAGVFVFDPNGVRNTSPSAGEKALYETAGDWTVVLTEDYGVIRMVTIGPGIRILSLAGRGSPGTYGVGEFFANPNKMKEVFRRLQPSKPGQPFPENWEALIRIEVRDNIPVDTSLVSVRVGSNTH